tara:strand:+ start:790 stop:912 length:123 start_codon:yes stop_codon:yes gene_type:complete
MKILPNGRQLRFKKRGKNEQIIIGEIKMFNFKNNNNGGIK